MIMARHAKKYLTKSNTHFLLKKKNCQETENSRDLPQLNREHLQKTATTIILRGDNNLEAFPLRLETRQDVLFHSFSLIYSGSSG